MPVSWLNASTICCGIYSDQQKMWRVFSASPVDSLAGEGVGDAGLAAAGLGVAGGLAEGGAGVFSQPKSASTAKNGSTTLTSDFFHELFRRASSSLNKTSTTVAMTKIVLRAFSCGLRPTFAIP